MISNLLTFFIFVNSLFFLKILKFCLCQGREEVVCGGSFKPPHFFPLTLREGKFPTYI